MVVPVSEEQIAAYADDGVVCIRGAADAPWIERLSAGLAANMAAPGERARLWDRDSQGRSCFYDSQAWQRVAEYREFVLESSLAQICGHLMQSNRINFFFDAIFVRTPGNRFRTPFHQDEPYWSVEGFDCCSVWMPLVPVAKKSALEFVRGSHRWGQRYQQQNFGALTGDERDQVVFGDDLLPFPDIEGDRERYDILSWDMEPGDVAVFNARTIHGGSGNLDADRDLKVFNTQWLGDDVRVCFRPEGMDPDHSQVMSERGLKPGDRVGTEVYPEVWRRSEATVTDC